jgi:2-C-methyl-D-erythritol 2,4-cyclodiphosphate synthase
VSSDRRDDPALGAILDSAAALAAEQGRGTVRVRDLADALAAAHADVPPIPIVRLQESIDPILAAARTSAGAETATVAHLLSALEALRAEAVPLEAATSVPRPQRRGVRTGIGYDSHRFAPGGPLVLGGLSLDSDVHLAGHSDGDAIAHAVTDAMLGAANAGDIGALFPDTDPAHAGRDSIDMLQRAHDRVAALGWDVTYVDVTVIAEYPKIGPHRAAMCARVAGALGLSVDAVSIKGKTNETMGFVGRREGLAVIAVATIEPALP